MSDRPKPGVNRLLDIVVEEVSLVDRAANKHRFLIVKRSDEMDESTHEGSGLSPQDETEEAPQGGEQDTTPEESPPAADSAALSAALDALEELTGTVERLESLGGADAQDELVRVATELRAAADHLAPGEPPAPSEPAPDLAGVLAGVRETLGRIRASVAPKPETPAKPEGDDTAAALTRLAEQMKTLATTVQEQQARLGRIEKRFGLPHSAAAGESVQKSGEADGSWPLDLNRPMDRESVDKAVSFHEL